MTHENSPNKHVDVYSMKLGELDTEALAERFWGRISELELTEVEHVMIQAAYTLAMDAHKDARRTYEPYANHLIRVALRLIENMKVVDPEAIAAALLHDSVEDHSKELGKEILGVELDDDAPPEVIRELGERAIRAFGAEHDAPKVGEWVIKLSNDLPQPGQDRVAAYIEKITTITRDGSPMVVVIKNVDGIDNMTADPRENKYKRVRLDEKQMPVYDLFIEATSRPDLPLSNDVRDWVRKEFTDLKVSAEKRARDLGNFTLAA